MNYCNEKSRKIFNFERLCIRIFIMYIFKLSNFVLSNKYVYRIEKNENSEIIFYKEIQDDKDITIDNQEEHYLRFLNTFEKDILNDNNYVFKYGSENFIRFETLDNILYANTSENETTKIECNFDLIYFLKLTKDIFEMSDKLTRKQFECLLITLKYLKALEKKNIIKYFQAFFFKIFINQNENNANERLRNFEEILSFISSERIDIFLKESIIAAFLKTFIIKHVFFKENLFFLRNNNDSYNTVLINEHIPYKNLVINDFKIFFILENYLENGYILSAFKVILNELHIKSLAINNCLGFLTQRKKTKFYTFQLLNYKSIAISKLIRPLQMILNKLNRIIDSNLEYFTLKDSTIDYNLLIPFLRRFKLKGLILYNVNMVGDYCCFDNYMSSNTSFEYFDFSYIDTRYKWIKNLLEKSNIQKIIIRFKNYYDNESFFSECRELKHEINVLYLEIMFESYKFSETDCNFLSQFKSLKTLKFYEFSNSINIECGFIKAIENMKELEFIKIERNCFSKFFFAYILRKESLRIIDVDNKTIWLNSSINLFNNKQSLTELHLKNMKIEGADMMNLFKIESLKVLSLSSCFIYRIEDLKSIKFMSKNIKSLSLQNSELYTFINFNILDKLEFLESLSISRHTNYLCRIANLNSMCNLRLKKISFIHGHLYLTDLNRMKWFTVLEELNLRNSTFKEGGFCQLGDDCKFLNSLVCLDLLYVDIEQNCLEYLTKFKHLKNLKLTIDSRFKYVHLKFSLFPLQSRHISCIKKCSSLDEYDVGQQINEESIEETFIFYT